MRPVKAYPNVALRLADSRARDIDLVVLREYTEGLFYSAAVHDRNPVATDDEVQDILRVTRKTTEKLHDFALSWRKSGKIAEKRHADLRRQGECVPLYGVIPKNHR